MRQAHVSLPNLRRFVRRSATFLILLSLLAVQQANAQDDQPSRSATPVDQLRLLPDFKAELIYSVPVDQQGSWVSLTVDPAGRLITSDQYGKLYRITPSGIEGESKTEIEQLDAQIGMAQGLLYAFDSLYVMVNGNAADGAGLYRLRDTTGDDQFDQVQLLRKIEGGGEHGPHAIVLSPDKKSLFICGGNHTKIPSPEESLVPRNWGEDQLLPSMPDAGGHAVGIKAPGGWIAQTDPEGKSFKLISSGFRNEYDIAFNSAGELFTYDADMEWDVGSPWYRPTRVCHATDGSEFGWRTGTGKWPVSYPDSLPPVVNIGPGSPTGIGFGYGTAYPGKYQNALFIADWSYGIIYAVHLTPDGATYSGELEQFCSAPALQVADMVVNQKDKALYFVIGGRRTQSGLYRITYTGDESTEPVEAVELNELAELRREIESKFGESSNEAIQLALDNIGHEDRFVAFAARILLEHVPVDQWILQALSKLDTPTATINGMIALARCGDESMQGTVIERLRKIDWDSLGNDEKIALLRAYGLVLIRLGEPTDQTRISIIEHLSKSYPTEQTEVNRELCRLLIAVNAPNVIEKTMRLLENSPAQEEQIHYALCLRSAKGDWSLDQRRRYLEWFNKAASLRGGNSFNGFIANIRRDAIATFTDEEKTELKETLEYRPQSVDALAELKKRPVVKQWTVSDLLSDVEEGLQDRDLKRGKDVFAQATCYKCHRFEGEGGIVGPDLTAVGRRFNDLNLLESLVEPSKVISDQYQATVFVTDDGRQVVGRVANLNGDNYMVQEDMLDPGRFTSVNRFQIEDMAPSTVSMMPNGLLDTFTKEEILDMIAYLKSATDDVSELKKN